MPTSYARNEDYFRRQARYWLIAAGVVALAWLVIWLTSSAPAIIKPQTGDDVTSADLTLPSRLSDLNELNKEVQPLDFSTLVRDMRSYPAEFKDRKYFNGMSGRYTVQLMDVAENDVIVDYLNGRQDRDKFAYFRYLDKNEKPRYILTYGNFASQAEADAELAKVSFALPETLKLTTVRADSYLDIIDNYELGEAVTDLSSSQPRRIRLQATRSEIPVQAATRADEELARRSLEQIQANNSQGAQTTIETTVRQAGDTGSSDDNRANDQATRNNDLPEPPTINPAANATEAKPKNPPKNQDSAPAPREPSRNQPAEAPQPTAEN